MISFFVPGIPVAKGSAKAFYNPKVKRAFVVQDNSARQKPWVSMISVKAEEAGAKIVDGPVEIVLRFYMPRPKSHYNSKGILKPLAPALHKSKPDLDKLARAVLDSLTSIVWHDDSQVCVIDATKVYAVNPGVQVEVREHSAEAAA